MVQLLIDGGADVNAKTEDGSTALYQAAYRGYEAAVKLLIDGGADVNAKTKDGWTALYRAAYRGYEAVVDRKSVV